MARACHPFTQKSSVVKCVSAIFRSPHADLKHRSSTRHGSALTASSFSSHASRLSSQTRNSRQSASIELPRCPPTDCLLPRALLCCQPHLAPPHHPSSIPYMSLGYTAPVSTYIPHRVPQRVDELDPRVVHVMVGFEIVSDEQLGHKIRDVSVNECLCLKIAWTMRAPCAHGASPCAQIACGYLCNWGSLTRPCAGFDFGTLSVRLCSSPRRIDLA